MNRDGDNNIVMPWQKNNIRFKNSINGRVPTNARGAQNNGRGPTNALGVQNNGRVPTNARGAQNNALGVQNNGRVTANARGVQNNTLGAQNNARYVPANARGVQSNALGVQNNGRGPANALGVQNNGRGPANARGVQNNARYVPANARGAQNNGRGMQNASIGRMQNKGRVPANARGGQTASGDRVTLNKRDIDNMMQRKLNDGFKDIHSNMNKLFRLITPVVEHVKPIPRQGTFIKLPMNEPTTQYFDGLNIIPDNMKKATYILGNHDSKHGRGLYSADHFSTINVNPPKRPRRNTAKNGIIIFPNGKNNKNNVITF